MKYHYCAKSVKAGGVRDMYVLRSTAQDMRILKDMVRAEMNDSLPLLKFPREIRDTIYKYALGGKIIRIRGLLSKSDGVSCDNRVSILAPVDINSLTRGKSCDCNSSNKDIYQNCPDEIQVQLLLSCKEGLLEAKPILWASNVFLFRSLSQLVDFAQYQSVLKGDDAFKTVKSIAFHLSLGGDELLHKAPVLAATLSKWCPKINNLTFFVPMSPFKRSLRQSSVQVQQETLYRQVIQLCRSNRREIGMGRDSTKKDELQKLLAILVNSHPHMATEETSGIQDEQ